MRAWKIAVLAGALVVAAALAAAFAPGTQAQTRPARAQAVPRIFQNLTGSGSEIGVTIRDVGDEDAKRAKVAVATGAAIASVRADGPAAQAGMKDGDIVTEFDGERIRGARQFARVIDETPDGKKVQSTVLRDGQKMTLTVEPRERRGGYRQLTDLDPDNTFGDVMKHFHFERPTPPEAPLPPATPAPPARPPIPDFDGFFNRDAVRLGITVDELSQQLAEYFGARDGVLVTSVRGDSAGARAGLKAGDVITSFNGVSVGSASDLRRRIQRLDDGDEFTVEIVRDKKIMTLKGKLENRDERRRSYRSLPA